MHSSNQVQITVNEFNAVVKNRRDLYEAVVRNGYYLPKYKSSMVTEDYMRNVFMGKEFCLKYSEVRQLPCPRPPTVDVLLRKFHEICRDKNLTVCGVNDTHIPDKRWLLDFISTLRPEDEIFKKNYLPPVKDTKLSELKTIPLPATFLQDLP